MTVSAHNPCRMAFCRDWLLPSSVFGPVLLMALRRLASIWRNEVMGWCAPLHSLKEFFVHHRQDQSYQVVSRRLRSSYGHLPGSSEAGSPPKALLPPPAEPSPGWPTTPFRCHGDAAHHGTRGT